MQIKLGLISVVFSRIDLLISRKITSASRLLLVSNFVFGTTLASLEVSILYPQDTNFNKPYDIFSFLVVGLVNSSEFYDYLLLLLLLLLSSGFYLYS